MKLLLILIVFTICFIVTVALTQFTIDKIKSHL